MIVKMGVAPSLPLLPLSHLPLLSPLLLLSLLLPLLSPLPKRLPPLLQWRFQIKQFFDMLKRSRSKAPQSLCVTKSRTFHPPSSWTLAPTHSPRASPRGTKSNAGRERAGAGLSATAPPPPTTLSARRAIARPWSSVRLPLHPPPLLLSPPPSSLHAGNSSASRPRSPSPCQPPAATSLSSPLPSPIPSSFVRSVSPRKNVTDPQKFQVPNTCTYSDTHLFNARICSHTHIFEGIFTTLLQIGRKTDETESKEEEKGGESEAKKEGSFTKRGTVAQQRGWDFFFPLIALIYAQNFLILWRFCSPTLDPGDSEGKKILEGFLFRFEVLSHSLSTFSSQFTSFFKLFCLFFSYYPRLSFFFLTSSPSPFILLSNSFSVPISAGEGDEPVGAQLLCHMRKFPRSVQKPRERRNRRKVPCRRLRRAGRVWRRQYVCVCEWRASVCVLCASIVHVCMYMYLRIIIDLPFVFDVVTRSIGTEAGDGSACALRLHCSSSWDYRSWTSAIKEAKVRGFAPYLAMLGEFFVSDKFEFKIFFWFQAEFFKRSSSVTPTVAMDGKDSSLLRNRSTFLPTSNRKT